MTRRILIAGGGISGLSTAEALSRRSAEAGIPVEVEVLEAADVPGGKVRSSVERGFVLETGPHGFLDREPKMFELIDRLGLRAELIPADTSSARRFIVRAQKLRELPVSPLSFIWSDILPFTAKLRVLMEPFARGRPEGIDESVWGFAARRIGATAADVLVDAMVTGIYGGDPKALSLRSSFPRMHELESKYGGLVRAQLAIARERRQQRQLAAPAPVATPTPKQAPGAPTGTLHSFKKGLGTLTTALADRTTVRLSHPVQALRRSNGRFEVTTPHGVQSADAVVVTTPCAQMADLLEPWGDAATDALREVPYVACHVVIHGFAASAVPHGKLDGFGFLIPGGEGRDVLGSIWASSVFPDHVPGGTVMFRTMLGGARRPDLADASEEELLSLARSELTAFCGLDPKAEPIVQRVIRWQSAIPQYNQGHQGLVDAADGLQSRFPGLFLSGNGLRGVAMLNCVAESERVADTVLKHVARKT